MIQYWSWWNLSWFLGSELGLLKKTYSLKTSLIVTSVVGGYLTYVYPKRLVMRFGNKKYELDYKIMVIGDLFLHHVPLILFLRHNNSIIDKSCATNVLIPFGAWNLITYVKKIDQNKLYGIKIYKIFTTSTVILCSYGICYHFLQKKN